MTRYAVGDIQGCYDALRRLMDAVNFDDAKDELWCTGDLINRGPKNVETLRFLKSLSTRCKTVLGNHDLHYLAVERGLRRLGKKDTLSDLLQSDDRAELTHWLSQQPLAYRDQNTLMVHAGVVPAWTADDVLRLSAEVHAVLQCPDERRGFFEAMYGNSPHRFNNSLTGHDRHRVIVNILTRMRFCTQAGVLDLEHKGGPLSPPAGFLPWYAHTERRSAKTRILFGHWAALEGLALLPDGTQAPNVHALDTGCVWGGSLSALCLESLTITQVPARMPRTIN